MKAASSTTVLCVVFVAVAATLLPATTAFVPVCGTDCAPQQSADAETPLAAATSSSVVDSSSSSKHSQPYMDKLKSKAVMARRAAEAARAPRLPCASMSDLRPQIPADTPPGYSEAHGRKLASNAAKKETDVQLVHSDTSERKPKSFVAAAGDAVLRILVPWRGME